MGLDTAVSFTARSMIRQFGVDALYERPTGVTYTPGDGGVTLATQTFKAKVLFGRVSRNKLVPGTQLTTLTLAAEGMAFTPETGGRFKIVNQWYTVQEVERTYAQGRLALYTLGVSR